ncbi:MAG: BlaI/MecI/CopY family transcriptional regulator [Oscillospiraceae bacterium]
MKLTESEIQIMELFWNIGKNLTAQDILDLSPADKAWKDRSIFIMLQTLLKKEAVRELGAVKGTSGKYVRIFEACISHEDYYSEMISENIAEESLPQVFASLLDNAKFSKDTLSELERVISYKIKEK